MNRAILAATHNEIQNVLMPSVSRYSSTLFLNLLKHDFGLGGGLTRILSLCMLLIRPFKFRISILAGIYFVPV